VLLTNTVSFQNSLLFVLVQTISVPGNRSKPTECRCNERAGCRGDVENCQCFYGKSL